MKADGGKRVAIRIFRRRWFPGDAPRASTRSNANSFRRPGAGNLNGIRSEPADSPRKRSPWITKKQTVLRRPNANYLCVGHSKGDSIKEHPPRDANDFSPFPSLRAVADYFWSHRFPASRRILPRSDSGVSIPPCPVILNRFAKYQLYLITFAQLPGNPGGSPVRRPPSRRRHGIFLAYFPVEILEEKGPHDSGNGFVCEVRPRI